MRKSYLRGTRLKIFLTIILVFVSLIAIRASYSSYTKSAETLYTEGDQFTGKHFGITYIKLEGLEELDIVDEKLANDEKFYMVQHEHGFVILKATKEDVKKLIHSSDVPEGKIINLEDKNIYSRIDVIREKGSKGRTNISSELLYKFQDVEKHSSLINDRISDVFKELGSNRTASNYKSKIQEKPFVSNVYITVPGNLYYLKTYGLTVVIVLATLFLIRSIITGIRKSRIEYEELFIEYPETEYDIDILSGEAKYINKNLKVLIYKDALIFYDGVFNFELLSRFLKITFNAVRDSKGRVIEYTAQFYRDFEDDEVVKISSNYNNIKVDIIELGKTLKEKYGKEVEYDF